MGAPFEQVAAQPLQKTPPDWSASATEMAALCLWIELRAKGARIPVPEQVLAVLEEAVRRLDAAAAARSDSLAEQGLLLPDPAAAIAAVKGE